MNKSLDRFGKGMVVLVLIILAVSLQGQEIFIWFGVKPNLILAVLIASALVLDFSWYLTLLVIGSLGIEFYPGIGRLTVSMLIAGALIFWLRKRFLAGGAVALLILSIIGTSAVYLILNPSFIFEHFSIFIIEAIYNLIVSVLVFLLLLYIFDDK